MAKHTPIPRSARRLIDGYQSAALKALRVCRGLLGDPEDVDAVVDTGTHRVAVSLITVIEAMIRRLSVLLVPYILLTRRTRTAPRDGAPSESPRTPEPKDDTYPGFTFKETHPAQNSGTPRVREEDREEGEAKTAESDAPASSPCAAEGERGTIKYETFPLQIHLFRLERLLLDPFATAKTLARKLETQAADTLINAEQIATLQLRVVPKHIRKQIRQMHAHAMRVIEQGKAQPCYLDPG